MGRVGDENSAIVLAPHKEKWLGQMIHMIWTNQATDWAKLVPSDRLQTADL